MSVKRTMADREFSSGSSTSIWRSWRQVRYYHHRYRIAALRQRMKRAIGDIQPPTALRSFCDVACNKDRGPEAETPASGPRGFA
jgi:hypothetical protein